MKAIVVNGSPRKGWNTEMLLKEALRGAASVRAETEIIQLYDLRETQFPKDMEKAFEVGCKLAITKR